MGGGGGGGGWGGGGGGGGRGGGGKTGGQPVSYLISQRIVDIGQTRVAVCGAGAYGIARDLQRGKD